MKYIISLIFVWLMIISISCENFPFGEEKNQQKSSRRDNFLRLPEGNYYGKFYSAIGYGRTSLAEYQDTLFSNKEFEDPPRSRAVAYFGNYSTVDYCKLNGGYYEAKTNNNATEYYYLEPALYLDGRGNVYEWSIGNQIYRDTLYYNAPLVQITAPRFMETYLKNQDLIIRWEPSEFSDDVVVIDIQGCPPVPVEPRDTTFKISYFQFTTDDDGEFIIPASIMGTFYENKASITLTRGTYKESWHGGNKYIFVIYCTHGIDIRLQ